MYLPPLPRYAKSLALGDLCGSWHVRQSVVRPWPALLQPLLGQPVKSGADTIGEKRTSLVTNRPAVSVAAGKLPDLWHARQNSLVVPDHGSLPLAGSTRYLRRRPPGLCRLWQLAQAKEPMP